MKKNNDDFNILQTYDFYNNDFKLTHGEKTSLACCAYAIKFYFIQCVCLCFIKSYILNLLINYHLWKKFSLLIT